MLFLIQREEMLTALKRFRGIAKQDLLIKDDIAEAAALRLMAEARRAEYGRMAEIVEKSGVEAAYKYAIERYIKLPLNERNPTADPEMWGSEKALELSLELFGLEKKGLRALKATRRAYARNQNTEAVI